VPTRNSPWIPDAALACAALTLLYCLAFYDGWRQLFRDSDSGWHIRAGEQMLRTHALPRTDPYSFSRPGAPWIDWEWASDVLTGLAHLAGGLAAVAALYAALIALATWLWWQLTWAASGDFLLGWLLAAPMLSTTNLHWLARPHVFSWCCALIALILIESGATSFFAIAVLSAVWANLHASFFLLPVFLLIYACGDWISSKLLKNTPPARTVWLLQAAAIAIAASFINPYGFHLHQHVASYLTNSELLDRIGEFQTFNFHSPGAGQILLGIGIAALGGVLALTQGRVAHFLLTAVVLALAIRSARGLPLAALLLLPLSNGAILRALRLSLPSLQPGFARRLQSALTYSANLRALDLRHSGLALVPLLLVLLILVSRSSLVRHYAGFPPSEFPVEAARHLPAGASRLLAPDKFGGYLIYASDGSRKVYFDGRSDFYGSAFMKNYINLVEVRPNWQDECTRQGFTHALLPVHYSLIPALLQTGWRPIYNDEVATILER
jgi:hypothetical protein